MAGERNNKILREWNKLDSLDSSDVCLLYQAENLTLKSGRNNWRKYFSVYFVLIGFITLFLFGILVGFYVRESQKVSSTCDNDKQRKDGFDYDKVQSVHQNIMYYMSQKSIIDYKSKLEELRKAATSVNLNDDPQLTDYISQEFRKIGLDSLKIEEHSVVVAYPDSRNPNRLEFLSGNGTVTKTVSLQGRRLIPGGRGANSSNIHDRVPPFAAFSPSGFAEGGLVYGHYGRYIDHLQLQYSNTSVRNAVLLLRHGIITDARKVEIAEKFGASGVLLYCHTDDCLDPEPLFTSVADFSDLEPFYPAIPVQTVSQTTAAQLLRNISTTSLPATWLPSVKKLLKTKYVLNKTNASKDKLRVRLRVNTVSSTVVVSNVVGIIHGGTESDRFVMVGADRPSSLSSSSSLSAATTTNTAILLELARSLAYIKNTEGWVPRRGIKLCSWGGGALSKFGVYNHFWNNRDTIQASAINNIDLDLLDDVSKVKVTTSPGLVNLVTNVAQMVPDPLNGDQSLGDSWPELRADNLIQDNSSLAVYSDIQSNPLLRAGISAMKLTSRKDNSKPYSKPNSRFLLSNARVVSLLLSQLADHQYFPVSVERYAQFVHFMVNKILGVLKQYSSKNLTDSMAKAALQASQCVSDLKPVSQWSRQCRSQLQVRKINNILQKLDSCFLRWIPSHGTSFLLSLSRDTTPTLEVLASALAEYQITGGNQKLNNVVSLYISSLQNFSTALCQLKQLLQNS